MKEVTAARYAGPFETVPFKHYVQSPIRLVLKDKGKKTRLIFHLSYSRGDTTESINAGIPHDKRTVKYPDFDQAIKLCLIASVGCSASKSNMSMAFRHVPLLPRDWSLLIMKARHPKSGKTYFFVQKCLPFGSSISCKIFQEVSDAIAHIVKHKCKNNSNVNYLDDFLFVAALKAWCNWQLKTFLQICEEIKFPAALEKIVWGSTLIIFLGLLLDTQNQVLSGLELIKEFIPKKKVQVHQVQKLCGVLNFLCRCVVPGHAFLRRTYSLVSSKLKPHHHINVNSETQNDMHMWEHFLEHPDTFCHPFMDFAPVEAAEINFYSDASKCETKGFGALCNKSWMFGSWGKD